MISNKEKLFWAVCGALLVILFLLSSTDLIIKEQKNEVYPISIVLESASDDNYVNFRKGVDQAAVEWNADVSVVTLYEDNSWEQQEELLLREQEGGAAALVVVPVNREGVEAMAAEKRLTVPVVFANAVADSSGIAASVTADYDAMGQQLVNRIEELHGREIPVYLFGESLEDPVTSVLFASVQSALQEKGFQSRLFLRQESDTFRRALEELVRPGNHTVAVAALDPESLRDTASILADNSVYASHVAGLYGRGASLSLLNYLDRRVVDGLGVADEFTMGYLSVSQAVRAASGARGLDRSICLDAFYIERRDLRLPAYETMLYPIE